MAMVTFIVLDIAQINIAFIVLFVARKCTAHTSPIHDYNSTTPSCYATATALAMMGLNDGCRSISNTVSVSSTMRCRKTSQVISNIHCWASHIRNSFRKRRLCIHVRFYNALYRAIHQSLSRLDSGHPTYSSGFGSHL